MRLEQPRFSPDDLHRFKHTVAAMKSVIVETDGKTRAALGPTARPARVNQIRPFERGALGPASKHFFFAQERDFGVLCEFLFDQSGCTF